MLIIKIDQFKSSDILVLGRWSSLVHSFKGIKQAIYITTNGHEPLTESYIL